MNLKVEKIKMLDYLLVLAIISYHDNFCQKSHKTENNKI